MSEALSDLAAHIREKLGDAVLDSVVAYGELTVTVWRGVKLGQSRRQRRAA